MIFTKRKTIGVFISRIFTIFDNAVFRALVREGKRLDYDIVVFATVGYFLTQSDYDVQEKNIFRFAPVEKLDGIIIVPDSYEEGEFRDLLYDLMDNRVTCPVVAIRHEGEKYDCVFTDEDEAIRPLIRHLIEDHGLTRICFQTGFPGHAEGEKRLNVFRQEMEAHGLPVPERAICPGNMWTTCGADAYDAFFRDPDNMPEAVVCANDYMALGLVRELRKHGLRVPEDVIVTGFDNIPHLGLDIPSLTTVQTDFEGLVVNAMNHLDRQIRGRMVRTKQVRISQMGIFTFGESCGCGKRPADYFRDASEYMSALLEEENDQDTSMSNLSIDLGACEDLTQLHKVMISRRVEDVHLRDHYLCLFGEPDDLMNENSSMACLVHAIRDHQDYGMPMISFERSQLLPAMAERKDEPQMFFVKLLHQNRHNFGYSVSQYDGTEISSRCYTQTNALLSIALENIHRRSEMIQLYEERRLTSITDIMTGLMNRRGMMERLEPVWHSLSGRKVCFICIDMDYLKVINDTFGHSAGDYAICLVAEAIGQAMPGTAFGARIGGDEFIVFLPEAGNGEAETFINVFTETLKRLNLREDRSFTVTASAGYEVVPLLPSTTIEQCIQASDHQMYIVKEARHTLREK